MGPGIMYLQALLDLELSYPGDQPENSTYSYRFIVRILMYLLMLHMYFQFKAILDYLMPTRHPIILYGIPVPVTVLGPFKDSVRYYTIHINAKLASQQVV